MISIDLSAVETRCWNNGGMEEWGKGHGVMEKKQSSRFSVQSSKVREEQIASNNPEPRTVNLEPLSFLYLN
jgi:hypothetical protein